MTDHSFSLSSSLTSVLRIAKEGKYSVSPDVDEIGAWLLMQRLVLDLAQFFSEGRGDVYLAIGFSQVGLSSRVDISSWNGNDVSLALIAVSSDAFKGSIAEDLRDRAVEHLAQLPEGDRLRAYLAASAGIIDRIAMASGRSIETVVDGYRYGFSINAAAKVPDFPEGTDE